MLLFAEVVDGHSLAIDPGSVPGHHVARAVVEVLRHDAHQNAVGHGDDGLGGAGHRGTAAGQVFQQGFGYFSRIWLPAEPEGKSQSS